MADDRFERLANLVTFLLDAGERRSGSGATYAEIVENIPGYPEGDDARRRAFERDKKLLRDEDIPLVETEGRYRIPPEEYYRPDLGLTEDEQLALQLAVSARVSLVVEPSAAATVPVRSSGAGSSPLMIGKAASVTAHSVPNT